MSLESGGHRYTREAIEKKVQALGDDTTEARSSILQRFTAFFVLDLLFPQSRLEDFLPSPIG